MMEKTGKVLEVCSSLNRQETKKAVGSGLLQKGWGLVGDSHGGTEKEISLLSEEDVRNLHRETGGVMAPGCFAENIRTIGMDLISIPVGSLLQIGKAKVMVMQIGKDLALPHTYSYKGHSLLPTKGVFCKVVESGEVKTGDIIKPINC